MPRIKLPDNEWIEVRRTGDDVYELTANSIVRPLQGRTGLAFRSWDNEVTNVDNGWSDVALFLMSDHLRWNEVDLTPERFQASSFNRLVEALGHVTFGCYDPGDV